VSDPTQAVLAAVPSLLGVVLFFLSRAARAQALRELQASRLVEVVVVSSRTFDGYHLPTYEVRLPSGEVERLRGLGRLDSVFVSRLLRSPGDCRAGHLSLRSIAVVNAAPEGAFERVVTLLSPADLAHFSTEGWVLARNVVPVEHRTRAIDAICAFHDITLNERSTWYRMPAASWDAVPVHHAQAI
jgi:hypothetical protein